jgi:hypothetical protein
MTVGNVGASTAAAGMDNRPPGPPEITKSGLEEMRSRITSAGGQTPAGLDTLIEKFDDAAGSGGKMTASEFKAFAAANGVKLPDPPKAQGPGGARPEGVGKPPGGGAPPKASGSGGGAKSSGSSSSDDVSSLSDAQLQALAAKGDSKAIQEIEKRDAAKAQLEGGDKTTSKWPAAQADDQDQLGNAIDVYA